VRLKRSDKVLLGLLLLSLVASPAICMQQTTQPGLHHRSDENPDSQSQPREDFERQPPNTLPADVSGPYDFDHRNESIEIDIGGNKLTGYISRLGDAETDSNTPLTFFFDRTSVVGNQIQFQTRVVHGVWYSFHGTILRGDGKTREDEGYYVLHGSLQEHHPRGGEEKSADETIENRSVDFKSMRQ
jgi:hypothetical protein